MDARTPNGKSVNNTQENGNGKVARKAAQTGANAMRIIKALFVRNCFGQFFFELLQHGFYLFFYCKDVGAHFATGSNKHATLTIQPG